MDDTLDLGEPGNCLSCSKSREHVIGESCLDCRVHYGTATNDQRLAYESAWPNTHEATRPGRAPVDDIVGAVEIAQRLGVERGTVDQWRQRGIFPDPDLTVGGRPAWHWQTVEAWALESGRLQPPAPESALERELRESREADR